MSDQTSRLIVKSLPKNVTIDKLRTLFSKEGEITDLQLKYKADGTFRNFAFIGYKTEEEAARMKELMDNTCIDSCKISVEFCRKLFDGEAGNDSQQSKSKQKKTASNKLNSQRDKTNGNLDEQMKQEKEDIDDETKNIENDPEFMEFIQTQRNLESNKTAIWANDDLKPVNKSVKEKSKVKKPEKEIHKPGKPSVKGTFKFTVKIKRFPFEKSKRSYIKEFMAPLKPISVRVPPKQKGIAYCSFETEEEMVKALNKHRNVYAGKVITVLKYEVKEPETSKKANPKNRVEKQVSQDVLVDTGRIFVRNLYYKCTEEDLEKLFSQYGPLAEIHLPIDSTTKVIKGFGFVAFVFPEHAIKAFNELDGIIFQGRTLHLIPGESKPEGHPEYEAKSSFKRQKEKETKEKSGKGHNWNALFLNMNTLSDVISEKYSVTKSQLLMEGKSSESIPVRMALGETQIVNETAKFLTENGVKLDAFEIEKPIRSKTTILVKNLPAHTDPEELKMLFSEYGTINKIILPPMAVTAIVEVNNPVEARRVFKKFAYTNFKSTPLYLEWAPMDIFSTNNQEVKQERVDNTNSQDNQENNLESSKSLQPQQQQAEECESESTVLVKNLNFSTTENSLRDHFTKCGKIVNVTIVKKKSSDGTFKSLGYGFVQFKERKSAQKAMKSLQNSVLDDFTIELKISKMVKDKTEVISAEKDKKKVTNTQQTGSKILVRNIPFEANEKDVEQLFSAFGELKFVRLPKKFAGKGSHRGFGFVEFVSKDDAKRAFSALCLSTHLLGRRLVLEWATQEDNDGTDNNHESLEKASRKMHFAHDDSKSKRFKKSVILDELTSSKKKKDDGDDDGDYDV